MTQHVHIFFKALLGFALFATPPIDAIITNHGWAFLQRVRNNSEFPIAFYQDKSLHDYLPEGTVIRLKSLRPEYGAGRYLAVRLVNGQYRLMADTIDPEDPATLLTVSRYVARDFKDYIGLYSTVANNAFLDASGSTRAATFTGGSIKDDRNQSVRWALEAISTAAGVLTPQEAGKVLNACYLKSAASGYLEVRGGATKQYPGLTVKVTDQLGKTTSVQPTSSIDAPASADASGLTPAPGGGTNTQATSAGVQAPLITTYTIIPGLKAKFVSLYNRQLSYLIKTNNQAALRRESGAIVELGKELRRISAGGDGSVWGCDARNKPWAFRANKWVSMGGDISEIAVASVDDVYGVTTDLKLVKKDNAKTAVADDRTWTTLKTGITLVAAGGDGTVIAVGSDKTLYKKTATDFEVFVNPGSIFGAEVTSIAVGSNDLVAVITSKNELWVLKASGVSQTSSSWKKLDKTYRSVAYGSDGTLIGIDMNNDLYLIQGL